MVRNDLSAVRFFHINSCASCSSSAKSFISFEQCRASIRNLQNKRRRSICRFKIHRRCLPNESFSINSFQLARHNCAAHSRVSSTRAPGKRNGSLPPAHVNQSNRFCNSDGDCILSQSARGAAAHLTLLIFNYARVGLPCHAPRAHCPSRSRFKAAASDCIERRSTRSTPRPKAFIKPRHINTADVRRPRHQAASFRRPRRLQNHYRTSAQTRCKLCGAPRLLQSTFANCAALNGTLRAP